MNYRESPKNRQPSRAEALSFAYQSAKSLIQYVPDRVDVIYNPIYDDNAQTPETLPLNVEEEVLPNLLVAIRERNIHRNLSFHPYWNPELRYDAIEVLGATIQSFDLHNAPLPQTVLPPEENVAMFIDTMRAAPHKVRLHEQFTTALDIVDNNLLGAANLCWIATRFMARGADQRAYPNISMGEAELRQWNNQLAQFETYSNSGKNDGPGDNYYFWTHVFGAMVFSQREIESKLAQLAFSKGTSIMAFVRKNIAKEHPTISEHEPASKIGRAIGLALAHLDESNIFR
jgi:hypothetical protein